jgi:outer membrane lipoprotein-sorting protein
MGTRSAVAAASLAAAVSLAIAVDLPKRGTDQIARLCIVAFGGSERWRSVRDASYTQNVVRYGPGNVPWRERKSEIFLRYQPRRQCRIESTTDEGRPHIVIYDGERTRMFVGGKEESDPAAVRRAHRNALSTLYLFSLPFPLEDPGVQVTYRGTTTYNNRQVYRLSANLTPAAAPAPTTAFEYLIDAQTFHVPEMTYTVATDSVTYIVRWEDYRNFDGILRPMRWDYMASPRSKAMTVEFRDLRLNSGLSDALFTIPPGSSPSPRRPSQR